MWQPIKKHFKEHPAQEKVARLLLETGLNVKNNKIYCNQIEIPPVRIAKVVGVDRRAVNATIDTIEKTPELNNVFSNLQSTAFLKNVAPAIGSGLIEIIPNDASDKGIVAQVTRIIADSKISVRQSITDDPEFCEQAKLYIITETKIPLKAVEKIKEIKSIKSITIY